MNQAQQTARIGLFFILGVALIWITYATLSGSRVFKHGTYRLTASFDDLKELKLDDDVRMAGVRIGAVTGTDFTGTKVQATLEIDKRYRIPQDSVATIAMSGLLGSDFVSLTLGTPGAPTLADGSALRTAETPDLNTIMTDLGDLGQKLSGTLGTLSASLSGNGKNGGLIQELQALIEDNRRSLSATLTNLQQITDKINQGQGTIGKLVNDPALHDQLLDAVGELKASAAKADAFVSSAQGILDQVKSGQGALGTILYDPQTANNLKATLADMRSISDKLSRGEGTLGKLISDDSLYNSAQTALNKADRAIDTLGDSGPIEAVGIAANALF